MLIREALAQGGADLKYAGIKTPGLDASLLLAHVLKKSRTEIYACDTEDISDELCEIYCSLIERRCFGECAAYLTGKKEFHGLEFTVNKSVLVPRPDTETLVEAAVKTLKTITPDPHGLTHGLKNEDRKFNIKVLDLCTGSGAVAISLKHERADIEVHATDISREALDTAKENSERLLGENQIKFFHGDLFDAVSDPGSKLSYSLIISNPPYIPSDEIQSLPEEVQNEPRIALDGGVSGLDIIKRITDKAPEYLCSNGYLLLEADPRLMDKIKMIYEAGGFTDIELLNDLSNSQRVISGRYEK